jgi:signal transduction histidine kinase
MDHYPRDVDALRAALIAAEERLALVATVSELIGAFDDPADLLYEVSRVLGEHLRARRCLFTEIDLEHDRGIVRRDYCRGVASVAGTYTISDYSETTLREMQAGRIVINCDSMVDPRTAAEYAQTYEPHGERAYVAVPLLREGRWVAELWISDDVPRQWSEQDVALLQSVAERVWTAVEKLRVHAALHESLARERRLRAAADEASVAKDHFLALLSHELRTPMTTILGWASFLASGVTDLPTVSKGIESIEQSSRIQARLIEDLLDVSRIVTGKLALESALVNVSEVVLRATEGVQRAARSNAIELVTDLGSGPAFGLGDATRIQQVISNLLSNAVKFTPKGGRVEVAVREVAGTVEIRVRDTGVGIDPEFLPHVFERFRQADDGPSRRFGGLGLGLSIVRTLTELHGGSVHASSDGLGRGAEFVVHLPRPAETPEVTPQPETETTHVPADALTGVHVLVVDDDGAARDVIATMLTGFGARVSQVASADDALRYLARMQPNVLVSDIGMPGQDGYSLIEELRRSASAAARVPAVAVTAYADPRDRERALGAGFQAHLTKPVEPRALAGTVLRVLRA